MSGNDQQIRQERLSLLLEQLGIPDEMKTGFSEGTIEKLTIDKTNRSWHFSIAINRPLTAEGYAWFSSSLHQTFQHIAKVTFSLQTKESYQSEELLGYWPLCKEKLVETTGPSLSSMLSIQDPIADGNFCA